MNFQRFQIQTTKGINLLIIINQSLNKACSYKIFSRKVTNKLDYYEITLKRKPKLEGILGNKMAATEKNTNRDCQIGLLFRNERSENYNKNSIGKVQESILLNNNDESLENLYCQILSSKYDHSEPNNSHSTSPNNSPTLPNNSHTTDIYTTQQKLGNRYLST